MYNTEPLPMISLFTGAGGLDLGLEDAGFTTRAAVEKDKWARATLSAQSNRMFFRNPGFPILEDITSEECTPEKILLAAGLEPEQAELVSGGPPCQSFSTAGRRGSLGDPRGGLFRYFADVVRVARPRFFVMENVRGLLSAAIRHRPLAKRGSDYPPLERDEEQGSAFQVIRGVLEDELGYQITFGWIDAADYGVPQHRFRVLIMGSRDREFLTSSLEHLVIPTHRGRWRTLREGLAGLQCEEPQHLRYTADREAVMKLIPPGMNWRWAREHLGTEFTERAMGGAWDAGGGKVGFFRRLHWDKPSPTLPTSPIQKSTSLCHPDETRPLSVQEYAAIQQFPKGYEFAGGLAQKYKQIGNAVPVGLGRAVGLAMLAARGHEYRLGQRRLLDCSLESYSASPVSSTSP